MQKRTVEERGGLIRWLRPDYQKTRLGPPRPSRRSGFRRLSRKSLHVHGSPSRQTTAPRPAAWLDLLSHSQIPLTAAEIAARFKTPGDAEPDIAAVLESLNRLGEIDRLGDGARLFPRRFLKIKQNKGDP
ncbi:MAG: hypothetical protein WDN06_09415 [Asticcacaulis sp.]